MQNLRGYENISQKVDQTSQIRNLVNIIEELRGKNQKLLEQNQKYDGYFKGLKPFQNSAQIIDLKAYGQTVSHLL